MDLLMNLKESALQTLCFFIGTKMNLKGTFVV